MGWARPAQLTGPDSAQKGWADLGPTKFLIFVWARINLAHKTSGLGQNQLAQRRKPISAGPAPAWPSIKIQREGNYFPPPILLHADQMFCMQEETQVMKKMQGGEEFTWRGEGGALLVGLLRWRCCGGDRWLCRGSRTATPSSGATVPSGGERGYCSSLFLCFLSSSFVFQWFPFILPVCCQVSYPVSSFSFLSLCSGSSLSILSVLSLSVRFFFSSVRSPFYLFVSSSLACWRSVSIYRGQRERGLIMAAWGAGQRRSVG